MKGAVIQAEAAVAWRYGRREDGRAVEEAGGGLGDDGKARN